MSTPSAAFGPGPSGAVGPAVGWGALTHELIDDAAMFPPARVPTSDAVAAHRARLDQPEAWLVGALVVRASQVPEVRAQFAPDDHFRLAVVADGGLAEVAAAVDVLADEPWADVAQVEIAVPTGFDLAPATAALLDELPFTAPTYFELPWRAPAGQVVEALEVLAADGAERVKLRAGGVEPGSVPSSQVLAEFLHAVAARRLPFKLTAGLHHALPNVERTTGDRQHGFLNVLAAAAAMLDGGSVADARDLLDASQADPLVEILTASDLPALRRVFCSIGSCSVTDPYDDLVRLQLMAEG